MLYTEETVKANLRTREGKRVLYLAPGDTLTPGARDWLRQERIEILKDEKGLFPQFQMVNGAVLREKPENMTHLQGNVLVEKTHPRIRFRGQLDALEAEILLIGKEYPQVRREMGELLALSREMIRREVLEEALPEGKLFGLTGEELRKQSHEPGKYLGQAHFMPDFEDSDCLLALNRLRTLVRRAELAAVEAFRRSDGLLTREDIPRALNRMSSGVYVLMVQVKRGQQRGSLCKEGKH